MQMHNQERITVLRATLNYWRDVAESDLTAAETRKMAKEIVRETVKKLKVLEMEELKELG